MIITAANGGAILALASKVRLWGNSLFLKNSASDTGGAMYLQQSEVCINGYAILEKNTANRKRGAVHAVSSTLSLTLARESPSFSSILNLILPF